jgi:hypothetical protein
MIKIPFAGAASGPPHFGQNLPVLLKLREGYYAS